MQRIEAFLGEGEVPEWASTLTAPDSNKTNGQVGFSEATFEWQSVPKSAAAPSRFQLGPLDITFPKGKLTLVGGATGSGKSALLSALLGGKRSDTKLCVAAYYRNTEMHCVSGSVMLDKKHHQVAYCGQNPCKCIQYHR